jgi:hypothetical protein
VYELEVSRAGAGAGGAAAAAAADAARQAQLVLHSARDLVDLAAWAPPGATFLRVVDRAAEQLVSAHVTHGGMRLLVLHEQRNEEGIRHFCAEVAELYAKVLLNPFYTIGSRIESREFDARVRMLARRHLGLMT